jgi:hypothetical protein
LKAVKSGKARIPVFLLISRYYGNRKPCEPSPTGKAQIAQLVERFTENEEVNDSSSFPGIQRYF